MSIADELKKTDLFKEVETPDLEALIARMEEQRFEPGTVLFHVGEPGDDMYLIQSGKIRIFMFDQTGQEITITHYGANEIFGELSPIDQRPRSASAAAAEPLHVLVLHRDDFLAFLNERPQIGMAMMRGLSRRLRYTTSYLEEFKPQRFETAKVEKGEEFRVPAQPEMVELMGRISQKTEVIPDIAELVDSIVESEHHGEKHVNLFEQVQRAAETHEEEIETPKPASAGSLGIFGRIPAPEKKDEDE